MNHQTYKVCLPCDNIYGVELPEFGNVLLFGFELMCLYGIYKFFKKAFNSIVIYASISDEGLTRIVQLSERDQPPEYQLVEKSEISVADNLEAMNVVEGIEKSE
ncbi:predicted protein [Sclerotinia sclerotiorum 1980 UF-70]|uniref:Uncharacterized protein n=2 Tax=Sclerotinia sclerotiorum (strain ATCC 18683 / 1980 / Ss-1) TaxID=665079 RepID=A7F3V0_SCLS1|nr:predicted protein [Sclerotinia sclerotiorum 1980 UF-70]APA14255.1 hypothetical protein sscle_12g090250 [Sclerotinia sclerotiorum 1980 UF-70]EDN97421.1 predicted protein [Sclerotinia sclerotiorum 1980 UF-70]